MLLTLAAVALAAPDFEFEFEFEPNLAAGSWYPAPPVAELPPVLDRAEVPMWPDARRFRRHHDSALVGLAVGTAGAIVLAAGLPDRARLFSTSIDLHASGLESFPGAYRVASTRRASSDRNVR